MNPASDAPDRPLLRYYGAKFRIAPWIISFFPEHQAYVEPFGGSASVLIHKPRSRLEVINDLDSDIVNFFKVLRDSPRKLIRKIELTPWSRKEYQLSAYPCRDEVEQARRTFVHIMMSIPGSHDSSDGQWRHWARFIGSPLTFYTDTLEWAKERLRGVQIECSSYENILSDYDSLDALFYLDPPYVSSTRTVDDVYIYEWTDEQHIELARNASNLTGYTVISGYSCQLYTHLYEENGWKRFDTKAKTTGENRIESVWVSPRTLEALNLPVQSAMF